ncbi:MAG TPA: LysR substrate-binding domain-containing protein [Egibacteraceae bacterium]|nr:LysR substrate-binding domain-containing protein [Egibacteraceae bacterium]
MTFNQLRTFVAVADTGAVRAAAALLVVTPSAVSSALSSLQDEVGTPLVMREGRGLRLTEAGLIYADYARRILGLLDEARGAAAGELDPGHGELRLAAVTTAGEQIVPRLLAGFRNRYPGAGLRLEVGNRDRVHALLDSHEADVAIGGRPHPEGALQVHAVRRNDLVVVAPAGAYPGEDAVGWLGRQTWLLREHGSGTRATTEGLLEQLELHPRSLTLGSNVAIVEAVVSGLGVTLISHDAVARQVEDNTIMVLPFSQAPLRRDWHLVAHVGSLPATAQLFVDFVIETGQFHLADPERVPAPNGAPDGP